MLLWHNFPIYIPPSHQMDSFVGSYHLALHYAPEAEFGQLCGQFSKVTEMMLYRLAVQLVKRKVEEGDFGAEVEGWEVETGNVGAEFRGIESMIVMGVGTETVPIAQEASIEAVQFVFDINHQEEPEWMEWKEQVTQEVLVPEKENEYENPSSKLVLQAESKSDKDVVLGGKQVKDEDTREDFKANKEYARDKDKAMKIKEEEVYHKGRKPKFRDNGS
ncbi:hypothetical protein E3N88_28621 [Mikania micrantha]|uniref:Uncharacterized protein n=1 Tax=Mikania micrantha TaxID=192012 RepID=A0A5N6N165_9ASTR|nr:hypothetical protein E3N88_28621 [Mikania micrantha]